MPAWVDCTAGPSYYGGFAADMGPYIGPWPMLAPGEMGGLTTAGDELDFVLGFPNPAHPGDAYYGLDGSYDSPIWDAYRYLNYGTPPPDSFDRYTTDSVGAATTPDASTPQPAGLHLYVAAYAAVGEPPHPPEFYVPASYAASGASALQTNPGGWSAWQPSWEFSQTATAATGAVGEPTSFDPTIGESDTLTDVAVLFQASLDNAESHAATTRGGLASAALFDAFAEKRAPGLLHPSGFTQGQLNGNPTQLSADFAATPSRPATPPDPAMVFGVDYGQQPGSGVEVDYQDPALIEFQWGTLAFTLGGDWVANPSGSATSIAAPEMPVRIGVRDTVIPAGVGYGDDGTVIAIHTVSATTGVGGGGFGIPDSVAMPGGLPESITVVLTPEIAVTGSWSTVYGQNFDGSSSDGAYEWAVMAGWAAGTLPYSWETGPWRYWRPNTIGPTGIKWHTVGGHWATVGGATMRILTPLPGGSVWVDVVDGPA